MGPGSFTGIRIGGYGAAWPGFPHSLIESTLEARRKAALFILRCSALLMRAGSRFILRAAWRRLS